MTNKPAIPDSLYSTIAALVHQARQQVKQAVNQHRVQVYGQIGRLRVSGALLTKFWFLYTNCWYRLTNIWLDVEVPMFILKGLLRAESQEKVLVYLLVRGAGYGKSIAEFYGVPTNPIQKQLARLEADGVIVSQLIGTVRSYELNPRYPFLEPLKALLKAALEAYPESLKSQLLVQRTRPRQAGKKLETVRRRAND